MGWIKTQAVNGQRTIKLVNNRERNSKNMRYFLESESVYHEFDIK
jgi:hypothetical protein